MNNLLEICFAKHIKEFDMDNMHTAFFFRCNQVEVIYDTEI